LTHPDYINPVNELGSLLLNIEKPGRYTGGEFGILTHNKNKNDFKTIIAFPDLYEVGMGNLAVKIIYNEMNNIQGISCDRAFAPAPDFEKLLRENNLPLYGLDTGINLAKADLLMFTLGYELGLNGILTMLDVSGIPLHCGKRNENYPLIIAGGPAVSNPLPYSPFIDAFWMGEAEAGFFELVKELAVLKKEGQGSAALKAALFKKMSEHPNIWVKGKQKASRAITMDFSFYKPNIVYPVPSMKIIQHHGAAEIMRGCPNGCRFCHAGFWYRPARQKKDEIIYSMVNEMVTKGGWQEISLSSLSSGDFSGIDSLIENLNNRFAGKHVSFQLPSLKVSSFALSVLEKISLTRKSGLTFAVETPLENWQMAINKDVTRDSVVSIIHEAKKSGWKGAKFYFMIGLPKNNETQKSEEEEIVSFITDISRRTRMNFNISIGIFIPKPHTPYQQTPQIDTQTAEDKLFYLRSMLKSMGHKVSISDPLISRIEGLLSRGDEKAGFLCEEAWKGGSRLDPWSEYINKTRWTEILEENQVYADSVFSGANNPPWSVIDSCIKTGYLINEFEKSCNYKRTPSCKEQCQNCGIEEKCSLIAGQDNAVNCDYNKVNEITQQQEYHENKKDPAITRMVFSFKKEGNAVFHGHLSLIEIFSMAFRRAGLPVMYTQGFNPLAKIEFASPLSTGISTAEEYAAVDFLTDFCSEHFKSALNLNLPQGISIINANGYVIKSGQKKHSLSSLLWGFCYEGINGIDYINAKDDKPYRLKRLNDDCKSIYNIKRHSVLAKNVTGGSSEYMPYFSAYDYLYK